MKFFEKRGVALVVLVISIAAAVFIGQSRKDTFIAKTPTALLDVQYRQWVCDDAGLLSDKTEQLISTLDEVARIQKEGAAKRKEAEVELGRIEGELKQKLMELRS